MQNCKPDLMPNWENAPAGLRVIRYPDGRIGVLSFDALIVMSEAQARDLAQALAEFTATTVLVQAQITEPVIA